MAFDDDWDRRMDLIQKLQFALDWESNPTAQWNRVKTTSQTVKVLRILHEIAEFRSAIEVFQQRLGATFDIRHINQSVPVSTEKLADTDGVVQTDPTHAGGWWGLLTIDRSSIAISADAYPVRLPPGTATFHTAFTHLTTTARGSDAGMVAFVHGQRDAAGRQGLKHIAYTFKYLIQLNADDMVVKYLRALRGHGTEEVGHEHHLNDLVTLQRDIDERVPRMQMILALGTLLERFPQVFSRPGAVPVTHWDDLVADHLGNWLHATGNHATGLGWLRGELGTARTRWGNTAAMVTEIVGSRDREHEISESFTTRLATLLREVTGMKTQLQRAYRQGGAAERTLALTQARSTVDAWRTRFGSTTTAGGTSTQGSTTEVSGDGSFDILVADGSFDASETITLTLQEKFEQTMTAEREQSGSTTDTTTRSMSETLRSHWESLITMVEEYERQITVERSRSSEHTRSIRRVREIRDVDQQAMKVRTGIDAFMRAQGW